MNKPLPLGKVLLAVALTLGIASGVEACGGGDDSPSNTGRSSSPTESHSPTKSPAITEKPSDTLFPTPKPTDLWTPPGTDWITPTPLRNPTQPPAPIWIPEPTAPPTAPPTPEPTQAVQENPNYEVAQAINEMINQKRKELGLNQLTIHSAIVSGANEYAKFLYDNIIKNPVFPRVDHNLDGLYAIQRAEKYGYEGQTVGEILGARRWTGDAHTTAEIFMQAWLDSPGHHYAIIDPYSREIGVGCYQGPYLTSTGTQETIDYCVSNFGVPFGVTP